MSLIVFLFKNLLFLQILLAAAYVNANIYIVMGSCDLFFISVGVDDCNL